VVPGLAVQEKVPKNPYRKLPIFFDFGRGYDRDEQPGLIQKEVKIDNSNEDVRHSFSEEQNYFRSGG
jgi:hypothetical protein